MTLQRLMEADRFAALADIHGNRWALESVLDVLEQRGISHAVNLGDSYYGPLDPASCLTLLDTYAWPTVMGNQDRLLLEPAGSNAAASAAFVRDELGPAGLDWLRRVARPTHDSPGLLLCHGTPWRDDAYLVEQVERDGVRIRSPWELDDVLGACSRPLVLCGHSHVQRLAVSAAGAVVVNPGSVGLPAFRDDLPYVHRMESGSTHARFAILTRAGAEWQVEHVAIPYDVAAAVQAARSRGRDDWAEWLQTGWAQS